MGGVDEVVHQTVTWTRGLSRRSAGFCARLLERSFFGEQGLVGEVEPEADADQHQCIGQAQSAARKVLGCLRDNIVHVVIAGYEEQVRSLLARLAFQALKNVPGFQVSGMQDGLKLSLWHHFGEFPVRIGKAEKSKWLHAIYFLGSNWRGPSTSQSIMDNAALYTTHRDNRSVNPSGDFLPWSGYVQGPRLQ
jgi:hypothetical protein